MRVSTLSKYLTLFNNLNWTKYYKLTLTAPKSLANATPQPGHEYSFLQFAHAASPMRNVFVADTSIPIGVICSLMQKGLRIPVTDSDVLLVQTFIF